MPSGGGQASPRGQWRTLSVYCFKAGGAVELRSMSQHDRKGDLVDVLGDKAGQIKRKSGYLKECVTVLIKPGYWQRKERER